VVERNWLGIREFHMEIRGYGVVLVVHGGYEVVVFRGYEVVVHGYGEVRGYEMVGVQRDCDCVVVYDYVVVCGYVDHEIAEGLEVDHADVRRAGRVDVEVARVDVRREVDAVVDHADVQREARVRGEDLVPAAVEC